ncbi:hypothetical protein [Mannheimia haemolytica]|uniref:hypothetical protein n=1 Tax=Mannheimia haemolytica TaxID=75985 RepID=UPI0003868433|nr:hypothetical protein [Mannheimia haemolytica]EPZ00547.1 hypothetical protein L278_00765 [Mannheimia haemolytica D35]MDW1149426.1 hypothetical protein [Mannheimia haemolytica]MDW1159522.1 hypothetical protein [Mannheimia haemolytica]NBB67635.1 hypothetical protein [Mannheimia haemolytica]TRC48435.1 hypothetical protein FEA40_06410 [Mannheimia haemolytica]
MKKAMILLTAILVAGCDLVESKQTKNYIGNNITEICIDNVVYLVYSGDKKGGITPKINQDFYPYTCTNQEEKRNGKNY